MSRLVESTSQAKMNPSRVRRDSVAPSEGDRLFRSDEMARLIESLDWAHSPLGPIALWPQSLKTALNIILRSRFQMAIYWGPELIFLYNDAEREVIGDLHPYALGKPAREVLASMWDEVGPMLHKVLETGEATWSADRPLKFDRFGHVEEAFFTWSYSPIPGDVGGIGGVLLVTQETTRRVLAERQLVEIAARERHLRDESDSQRALLETVLNQMPAGVVIARAPSGEVFLANNEAERILKQPVRQLRNIEEYANYHLIRPDGSAYRLDDLPLARSVLRGEVILKEEATYQDPDGRFRVLLINSAPVRDETGKIIAGVAAFQDITDLRLAQEELLRQSENVIHHLTGKLMSAQEEERSRIARDLHDDVCQRLALLSMEVEQAKRDSNGRVSAMKNLEEIRKHCSEIAGDLQSLSHELHSSKLDYLGIVAAIRAFCREFSSQHGVSIDFTEHDVPTHLPKDVSLCLFRVTQEALHNALKYSGVRQFKVELSATPTEVQLQVTDLGAGFDVLAAETNRGLGLVSMQERVHLAHGRFSVESKPGAGTRIRAVVPLLSGTELPSGVGEIKEPGSPPDSTKIHRPTRLC
jgi:signal transduction histidine kinase